MAESPSIATVVSAMLRCDLVSILFGDLTQSATFLMVLIWNVSKH